MKNNLYKDKSDSALVQCFLGGDSRCFPELVARYHPRVHNLAHYILHNATLEKDAEQETFIIISNEIGSGHYHDAGHLDKYITTVAWKQAMLILRKERHYVHDENAFSDDRQVQEPAVDFKEQSKETALLRFAVTKLSPRYRQVLQLRDWDEMSFKEIGLRMDISEASACALHAKAKSRLKRMMEKIKSAHRPRSG